MLEIFLFINPLGEICYQTEQGIMQLISHSNQHIRSRFITVLSLKTINDVLKTRKQQFSDLNLRNQLADEIYRSALDFKAASFQGKKRGCKFLFEIQKQVGIKDLPYNEEVVSSAAKAAGLDWEMFSADRQSKLAIKSFHNDQKVAAEMNVTSHPTIVVYDEKNGGDALSFCGQEALPALNKYLSKQDKQTPPSCSLFSRFNPHPFNS